MEYKYCKKCGTRVELNDRTCSHCKYAFDSENESNFVETSIEESKNGKFTNSYFKILGIVTPFLIIMEAISDKSNYFIPITLLLVVVVSILIVVMKNKK
jgi:uncharacterized membrane protein YvbJ